MERLQAEGKSVAEACKQIAVSEHTFYKWRKRYGSMRADGAERLREPEAENARLKRLVAEQALDIPMPKALARGNF